MTDPNFLKQVRAMAAKKKSQAARAAAEEAEARERPRDPDIEPCCEGKVHIAYRGVSDDRMYVSHDRAFGEIKFFRPNGLRVFCANCRRRMI